MYRSADAKTGNWSEWHDDPSVSNIFRAVELRKFKGSWSILDWLSSSYGWTAVACDEGFHPAAYATKKGRDAAIAADAEMFREAPKWGIYTSKSPAIPIEAFRFMYQQARHSNRPRISFAPNNGWLIGYGLYSIGIQVGPLPSSLVERTKKTDWPSWIAFTPNGGWFYNTNVVAYENVPGTLISFLKDFTRKTEAGTSLISDIRIVSLSFGPQDMWVLIYDDEQTRFPREWHQDYPTVRRFACYCGKDLQEILDANIDNGQQLKQFLFVGTDGWLLLRDGTGFIDHNLPKELREALETARQKGELIQVAAASNGAWVITTSF